MFDKNGEEIKDDFRITYLSGEVEVFEAAEYVRELKEYLVDLRSETETNYMTLEDAIQGFISYTTDKSITLKNNMYLVFYNNQYGNSVGYFLIDYTNPSDVNSWQQWVESTVYDMRRKDVTLEINYGVQTLSEAIASLSAG